jgi:hypothetical protein
VSPCLGVKPAKQIRIYRVDVKPPPGLHQRRERAGCGGKLPSGIGRGWVQRVRHPGDQSGPAPAGGLDAQVREQGPTDAASPVLGVHQDAAVRVAQVVQHRQVKHAGAHRGVAHPS